MSNDKLPIAEFRNEIVKSVLKNPVIIVTAETGAGKSTQVPQFLMEQGLKVVVTQPRRLAARTVAERVAFETGYVFGSKVGFCTAFERCDSPDTQCLFVTDGLALVREMAEKSHCDVLILDEVHEWNINMEVLVAWTKIQIAQRPHFRVVIMSATMEAQKLSKYFNGAPIISVPGRTFPVEERSPGLDMFEDIKTLVTEGRNILVFLPGKGEIAEMAGHLKNDSALNAEILSLHGELSPEEQSEAFRSYSRPKIVLATNVAQTSVTIDDIDAVVDSGQERRIEVVDSVETLVLASISRADSKQRKGRAGRTKPGVYIDHCQEFERPEFPKAEILRVRLDQAVLRLLRFGLDMEEMVFFHQPPTDEIHEAKRALRALGCLDGNTVTKTGARIAHFPISCAFGRMVVEAEKLGVVDDILSIVAVLEVGGINQRVCPDCKSRATKSCSCWRNKFAPNEKVSDVLAQLQTFNACRQMTAPQMRQNGIMSRNFFRAVEIRKKLSENLRGQVRYESSGNRELILKAVCAGMVDHLYKRQSFGYISSDGEFRRLDEKSLLVGPEWIVGLPLNLSVPNDRDGGNYIIPLINMATSVSPEWLAEVAPQLVTTEEEPESLKYDSESDSVRVIVRTLFAGHVFKSGWVVVRNHPELARLRSEYLEMVAQEERYRQEIAEREAKRPVEDRIWEIWSRWRKPQILDDPKKLFLDENSVVPIEIEVYGQHPITGEDMRAFGTWRHEEIWNGQLYFSFHWTPVPTQVQLWANETAKNLDRARKAWKKADEAEKQAQKQAGKEAAKRLRKRNKASWI